MKEDVDVINTVKKDNYLKAGSLYLIGSIFNKGMVFLTIPIFTRILTIHEYGVINTYLSWVTIFVSILGLSLDKGVMIGFSEYEEDIDDFMSTITIITLLNSVLISFLIIAVFYYSNINIGFSLMILVIALFQASSTAVLRNYDIYLKFRYEYIKKSALEILPNLLTLVSAILIIVYFLNNEKHLGKIIPHSSFTVIFSILVLNQIFKKSKAFNKTHAKIALSVSIPFIFHGMSMTLLNQSDRIMITSLVNASETGIYSLIYNFSMAGTVIFLSLNNVWLPWFTKNMKDRAIDNINEKAAVFLLLMTLPTVGLILTAPELLRIIAPEEYWGADVSIPLIILSSYLIFIYSLYINIEHIHKKSKSVAVNTIVATVINIGLNYYIIQLYGYHGAAATTFVSYLILFYLHYRGARKLESELLPLKLLIKPLFLITLNVLIYYLFLDAFSVRWYLLILQMGYIALSNFDKLTIFFKRKD
ncbi:O-antigen/teichoic acid export membrane protein [Alkalibacterium olivapovliticus]|uniref:O-antigen/teichoic acid export membrane protein n=1 Tax=Alkalibacterium olivapovliticus TaxID=99907 RepID=A0A2T0W6Z7_9LACT|nr:O-antigen/teichoic acid export membrane protein [Alkalibacterium olivapovliticus]